MARLFDSLMRVYPIGSFLFWRIEAGHAGDFAFYGFKSRGEAAVCSVRTYDANEQIV